MIINKKKFSNLFADNLNRLDTAFDALALALCGDYGTNVDFRLEHSISPWKWTSWHVKAKSMLHWGDGWSNYLSSGQIEWFTTSKHYVRFEFTGDENGGIELTRVVIGDDKSDNLYPQIIDTCGENGIALKIEAKPEKEG